MLICMLFSRMYGALFYPPKMSENYFAPSKHWVSFRLLASDNSVAAVPVLYTRNSKLLSCKTFLGYLLGK